MTVGIFFFFGTRIESTQTESDVKGKNNNGYLQNVAVFVSHLVLAI